MRPLIVVGASDAMRDALAGYTEAGHIEFHPTAEAAHFALLDLSTTHPELELGVLPPEHGWNVHVAYGPLAYGPLMVGNTSGDSGRLPHTGHTLVLCWDVDPDPGKPHRVVEGQVTGTVPDTTVWQVAVAVSADRVVDLGRSVGLPFLVRYLEWKDGT